MLCGFTDPEEFLNQDVAVRRLYIAIYYPLKRDKYLKIKNFAFIAKRRGYSKKLVVKVIKRIFFISEFTAKKLVK